MALGSTLPSLGGYPFEVRHSEGAQPRARACAEVAAEAYEYFSSLFSGIRPDITVVVADEPEWPEDAPAFGMPFFSEERSDRAGVLVMPAAAGEFWSAMAAEFSDASSAQAALLAAYPDGDGGLDLQPFVDLITLHELGHAFEVIGGLRLPTSWLGEIFANLALHTFVAVERPGSLPTLEAFSTVGVASQSLARRLRRDAHTALDDFEAHYPGSSEPIGWVNYVWFQCRWQRLVAAMFEAEGEAALRRFWACFHTQERPDQGEFTAASLAPLLASEVSQTLGRAVRNWR